MPFTVFIDESGEAGIAKVRTENTPGASPYFVLGAVVAQPATIRNAAKKLDYIKSAIGKKKWKHATDIDHADKVFFARSVSQLNFRLFAVISNKSTLGGYADEIEHNPQKFYNKCVLYLLERVCGYLAQFGVREEEVSVVLERRNHNYSAMINYLKATRQDPLYVQSKSLTLLNPFSISTKPKGEDPLLEYADFVAHAVFQCVNKSPSNHMIPERRYFEELSPRFAGDERGNIFKWGLKCIHDLDDLDLDPEIRSLFVRTKVLPPSRP